MCALNALKYIYPAYECDFMLFYVFLLQIWHCHITLQTASQPQLARGAENVNLCLVDSITNCRIHQPTNHRTNQVTIQPTSCYNFSKLTRRHSQDLVVHAQELYIDPITFIEYQNEACTNYRVFTHKCVHKARRKLILFTHILLLLAHPVIASVTVYICNK